MLPSVHTKGAAEKNRGHQNGAYVLKKKLSKSRCRGRRTADSFFRGFDQAYPDLWRYHEWKREFDQYVASGNLPTMQTVRFNHDHTSSYGSAVAGVNTPETQQADCDFATGKLIEDIAHSPYASDTLIFIIEDDSQDGPEHVDSHRTTAYVVDPYVRKQAVVSKHYNTVSMLRTIEDVLGLPHLNLNTAYQRPMTEVFDAHSDGRWDFQAVASQILKATTLNLTGVQFAAGGAVRPAQPASWWAEQTKGFDWSAEDRAPTELSNQILWRGLKGKAPYPVAPAATACATIEVAMTVQGGARSACTAAQTARVGRVGLELRIFALNRG